MKKIVENQQKYFSGFSVENPKINTINLELTNICDLHCKMCKRGNRPYGFMPIELADNLLKEASEMGVEQIGLHTVGESILNPDIGEIIKLCKKYDFYTYLDVNGNSLTVEKSKVLVDSGLDSIKFSIDAADQELYCQIRCGGSFEKVYENIKNLRKIRDKKRSKMHIFALFIIMQENFHQLQLFKDKIEGYVDEIQYTIINNSAGRMSDNDFEKSLIGEFSAPNPLGVCANPWTRMVITWEGDVSMCCIDFDLDMRIGKYEKGNLASLWIGNEAQIVRQAILKKDFKNMPKICRNCDNLKFDMAERSRMINEKLK